MVIFHSYVRLPEGSHHSHHGSIDHPEGFTELRRNACCFQTSRWDDSSGSSGGIADALMLNMCRLKVFFGIFM